MPSAQLWLRRLLRSVGGWCCRRVVWGAVEVAPALAAGASVVEAASTVSLEVASPDLVDVIVIVCGWVTMVVWSVIRVSAYCWIGGMFVCPGSVNACILCSTL